MPRTLYLACYDITSPVRLRLCLKILKGYASGRQYSCFECYLNQQERDKLLSLIQLATDDSDTFALVRLNRNRPMRALGVGVLPQDEHFMWVG